MIVQNRLRIGLDHDEVQTLFSQFGITNQDVHSAIYRLSGSSSDSSPYNTFCALKRHCYHIWEYVYRPTITYSDFLEIYQILDNVKRRKDNCVTFHDFLSLVYPTVPEENGIKELIESESSRFSINHLWQIFGEINKNAKMGFLQGMNKESFIAMAIISRNAIMKDVANPGYAYIKLTHCGKSIIAGYDGNLYTTDGILVGTDVSDLYDDRNIIKRVDRW